MSYKYQPIQNEFLQGLEYLVGMIYILVYKLYYTYKILKILQENNNRLITRMLLRRDTIK